MEGNKLNLGLMDDIEMNNTSSRKEKYQCNLLDDWQNLLNENQQETKKTTKLSNLYQQSRLDDFSDNNIKNNQNKPNKAKKLFQNLNDFSFEKELRIKIFGIGGAGNNMVKFMSTNTNIAQESLFAINTDYQVLRIMPNDINLILIGNKTTNGFGSGSNPEIGREAAIESEAIIREILEDTDLLFIVSGMGKGTGTGASPIVAKIAQEMGIMTLALVNLPSISNEGKIIYERGQEGLKKLQETVSGILTISNEKLFNETDENISLEHAFSYANSVISNVINEIINLVTVPSQVNVDFNDLKTFFKEPTNFQLNTFNFQTHDNIENQIEEQLKNLIYQDTIEGARKAIVNFKLNPNISRDIVNNITKALMQITRNNQLEITFAIDYFENIECARISTLLAMNKTNEPIEIKTNENIVQPIKKQNTVELIEIVNTKDENSEKITTIELVTNELHDEKLVNNHQTNSPFREVLDGFEEIKVQLYPINNQAENTIKNEQYENAQMSRQEVRRNFIPTKKLNVNEPKTIQFRHPTGPKGSF